jgi:hypothetical protein
LVVAVRAPRKVTQRWWLQGQQAGSLTKNPPTYVPTPCQTIL